MTKLLPLITLIAFLSAGSVQAQVKKPAQKKIVQRDSIWYSVSCDTIFGRIEFPVDRGIVKGDGIIVKCWVFENRKKVPEIPIDTTKIKGSYWINTGISWGQQQQTTAMIKTSKGYVRVDEKYTFIPN